MTYLTNKDHRIGRAISQIYSDYGHTVSVEEKNKSLIKFGRNNNLSTSEETVWLVGGHEAYPTGNDINIITSTNAGDTQQVVIEGHTLSGSDLTSASQTATLSGLSNVNLTTPLYRVNRIYNNGATSFAGTVTVEATGAGTTHLSTDGTNNQSLKCATALSSVDYWLITQLEVGVTRANTRSVDFSLQVREFGKVFRTRLPLSCNSSSGSIAITLDPIIIIRPNSDIRMVAVSSGVSTGVDASIHGHLAIIN